jgi:hypothetical protein
MAIRVEVFKTNVSQSGEAAVIIDLLRRHFPYYRVNFDLEDCDLIMRVESPRQEINNRQIIQLLKTRGYNGTRLT